MRRVFYEVARKSTLQRHCSHADFEVKHHVKRVIGLVFICGAASCVVASASPAAPPGTLKALPGHQTPQTADAQASRAAAKEAARQAAMRLLAPGDEYFGPLKQSIIGIRNTLRDLGLRYDVNHDISKQTFASAQLTERSIRDWQKKYPKDGQLPRAVFLLQRLYTKVLSQESRDRARSTAQWLSSDFSRSPQARQLGKTLAMEHLTPLPAVTPDATTSGPGNAYGSVFGPAYPSEFSPALSTPQATAAGNAPGGLRPALPSRPIAPVLAPTATPTTSPSAPSSPGSPAASPAASPASGSASATPLPASVPTAAPSGTASASPAPAASASPAASPTPRGR